MVKLNRATGARWPDKLIALCTSVALERAAYYGLQSILALYLADILTGAHTREGIWLLPALAGLTGTSGAALAGIITGAFVSVAALGPVIGGIVADRLIGQHRAILTGGLMMTAGHGLLSVEAALLPALVLIALGAGLFKGPVAARLSSLYERDDPQRVEGFRLFYLAINIAGLVAPLVIGTLGERSNWHAAFALCCATMLAGLAIYYRRLADAPGDTTAPEQAPAPPPGHEPGQPGGLALLAISLALLTVPNAQLTNAYLMWVKRDFARSVWGWEFPASWMISADGLLSLAALAGSGLLWRWQEQRRGAVAAATKATLGAGLVVVAAGLLVLAALLHAEAKVPILWGLGFQLCNSLGLANVLPAAMAIFGQASAQRHAATAMAGFYLSLFAGGVASTVFASQFTAIPMTLFWALHALCALCGAAGLVWYRQRRR